MNTTPRPMTAAQMVAASDRWEDCRLRGEALLTVLERLAVTPAATIATLDPSRRANVEALLETAAEMRL